MLLTTDKLSDTSRNGQTLNDHASSNSGADTQVEAGLHGGAVYGQTSLTVLCVSKNYSWARVHADILSPVARSVEGKLVLEDSTNDAGKLTVRFGRPSTRREEWMRIKAGLREVSKGHRLGRYAGSCTSNR